MGLEIVVFRGADARGLCHWYVACRTPFCVAATHFELAEAVGRTVAGALGGRVVVEHGMRGLQDERSMAWMQEEILRPAVAAIEARREAARRREEVASGIVRESGRWILEDLAMLEERAERPTVARQGQALDGFSLLAEYRALGERARRLARQGESEG